MTNFTLTPDPAQNDRINQKVQKDIEYISQQVKKLLGKNLHSILLCGGFGRGEGSVTITGRQIHIVNDYDFTIVLNANSKIQYLRLYHQFHLPLEALAKKLAGELQIKQVDLSPKPLSYFKDKTLKIENYEVKKGHILIYGNTDPTQLMPGWKASDIPLFEGTWLFRNRGLGLVLAALYFINRPNIPGTKKENFVIECNKAQIAMGDAALLLAKKYHHLYHQRQKIAQKSEFFHIPNHETLKTMYTRALAQKLNPDFSQYENSNLIASWFHIRDAFLSFFKFFEQKRLNKTFATWTEHAELGKPEDKLDLKRLAGHLIRTIRSDLTPNAIKTSIKKSKPSYTIALVALTLASINKDGFDRKPMETAANFLNLNMSGDLKKDWTDLALAVLIEIHPGGEAGKTVKEYKEKYICNDS